MPQLKEDEWPSDGDVSTTEREALKERIPRQDAAPQPAQPEREEYPPALPPDATPTKD